MMTREELERLEENERGFVQGKIGKDYLGQIPSKTYLELIAMAKLALEAKEICKRIVTAGNDDSRPWFDGMQEAEDWLAKFEEKK